MGRIPEDDVSRVRDATDVVALVAETVVLQKKGRLLWGLCPFHAEKTGSFKVDPATQLWHCFGCGLGGDAFGFVMRTQNLDFPDAVRQLADRAGIEIREEGGTTEGGIRGRLLEANFAAANFFHRQLVSSKASGAGSAREYLRSRGFGLEIAKRFGVGFAPGRNALTNHLREGGFSAEELLTANLAVPGSSGLRDRFYERIMFPIRDVRGRVVGFGGRAMGEALPKYLNTQETPVFHKSQHLYGIDWAKGAIVRERHALVVEGYTDVIALHAAGIENAVATLGTALTVEHVRLLRRFASRVVYVFDGDAAGVRAAVRAADFVDWSSSGREASANLSVVILPEGTDPAEFVSAKGGEALKALVADAVPLMQFVIDQRVAEFDLSTAEGRAEALVAGARAIASLEDGVIAQGYAAYLADRLRVDEAVTVRVAVQRAKGDLGVRAKGRDERDDIADSGRTGAGGSGEPPTLDRWAVAERLAVGMVARFPEIRAAARELLAEQLISDGLTQRLLRQVLDSGDLAKGELYSALEAMDGETAVLLRAVLAVDDGEPQEVNSTFRELVRKLEEFSLERQIVGMKARMKSLDPTNDKEEYDRLFEEVARLERRKLELRTHPSANDDSEAGHA